MIRDHTDSAATNDIIVKVSTGESHVIGIATLTQLTINAGDGNDRITLRALAPGFAANITVNGQTGDDEFVLEAKDWTGR